MPLSLFTIGHSNHPIERFLTLLRTHDVRSVFDVRTAPASRRFPQFAKVRLTQALADAGIAYRFAGDALGGRPKDPALWQHGRPDYRRMIATSAATGALGDICRAAAQQRVCLMCAEKEPLDCHRCLMIAQDLAAKGTEVQHILADGRLEPQSHTEEHLLAWADRRQPELFQTAAQRLDAAYDMRADWLWKADPRKATRATLRQ